MKRPIEIGHQGSVSAVVGPDRTIRLGNRSDATVFATPAMIHVMEFAARNALEEFLEEDEESVGIDVQVEHVAATPPGTTVCATATITATNDKVITFEVEARDQWEQIGRGSHRRAIVQTDRFAERLAKRKASGRRPMASSDLNQLNFFKVELVDQMLVVQLHRPDKRNAICRAMTEELESIVFWLSTREDEIRAVLFHGGETFSAGDDVGELESANREEMTELSLRRGAVYRSLANLPQVTVAAIDGLCLGGGFVFASACDFRLATHQSSLGLPEVSLGWPPNYGQQIVVSTLGRSNFLQLALLASPMSARQALELGWLYQIVPSRQLLPTASDLLETIIRRPPDAVRAVKSLAGLVDDGSDATATDWFLRCVQSQPAQDSIRRFLA